ncbi:MAG: APC family permease, partial [Verrucomicrobiota bacterium]
PVLVIAVVALTLAGVRKSNWINGLIVLFVVGVLLALFVAGLRSEYEPNLSWTSGGGADNFFFATALMFVAYTGYGRIATMGEEVREPRKTIPKAMIVTLLVTMTIYVLTAYTLVLGLGDDYGWVGEAALQDAALDISGTNLALFVMLAATVAMISVLINLVLGLSRVVLAMGRRGDLPQVFASIDRKGKSPWAATLLVGLIVLSLTFIGDLTVTWTFSAFTVLIYYAITNFAALKIPPEQRLFPRWISVAGLISCLFLAFWVPPKIWLIGLLLLAVGYFWHRFGQKHVAAESEG